MCNRNEKKAIFSMYFEQYDKSCFVFNFMSEIFLIVTLVTHSQFT